MRNLLPNRVKQQLRTEYRLRLSIVGLLLFSVALLMAGVFLVPSYLLSASDKMVVEDRMRFAEQGPAPQEAESSIERLELAQLQVELLSTLQKSTLFSDRLIQIIEQKPAGVRIGIFFYTTRDEGENMLTLSGVAETREDLLSFERSLKSEPDFSSVTLPVSNLAKDRDLSFLVTIKGSF